MKTTNISVQWHPDFIAQLNVLATKWGVSLEIVAAAWRQYSADCIGYDQSALVSEFERWVDRGAYKEILEAV